MCGFNGFNIADEKIYANLKLKIDIKNRCNYAYKNSGPKGLITTTAGALVWFIGVFTGDGG
jgi:hypothetical protein